MTLKNRETLEDLFEVAQENAELHLTQHIVKHYITNGSSFLCTVATPKSRFCAFTISHCSLLQKTFIGGDIEDLSVNYKSWGWIQGLCEAPSIDYFLSKTSAEKDELDKPYTYELIKEWEEDPDVSLDEDTAERLHNAENLHEWHQVISEWDSGFHEFHVSRYGERHLLPAACLLWFAKNEERLLSEYNKTYTGL